MTTGEPRASTQAARRLAELGAKLGLLRGELAYWQQLAEPGGVLEKHHSQLLRLGQVLGSALTQLDGQRDDVEAWPQTTDQLLGIHHVWDFFRAKLALRMVDRFRPPLIGADELAWACVRPLHAAAVEAKTLEPASVREPPLVYFDSSGSPFALGRRHAYRNLLPAKRLTEVSADLVKRLPVPVIGIPWHQQAHLPETAVVAHEAAHIVDDDLGLLEALQPVVDERLAGDPRLPDWQVWLSEVLADVLAALRLGPAYGQALADLVATTSAANPGPDRAAALLYPPPVTRIGLVAATLRRAGHPGYDDHLDARTGVDSNVDTVVEAVAGSPLESLGGKSLLQVDPFTAADQTKAVRDAERLHAGVQLTGTDPRVLVAAGVRAFADDPMGFVQLGMASTVFTRILSVRAAGTRADQGELDPETFEQRDQSLGSDLLGLLA